MPRKKLDSQEELEAVRNKHQNRVDIVMIYFGPVVLGIVLLTFFLIFIFAMWTDQDFRSSIFILIQENAVAVFTGGLATAPVAGLLAKK